MPPTAKVKPHSQDAGGDVRLPLMRELDFAKQKTEGEKIKNSIMLTPSPHKTLHILTKNTVPNIGTVF